MLLMYSLYNQSLYTFLTNVFSIHRCLNTHNHFTLRCHVDSHHYFYELTESGGKISTVGFIITIKTIQQHLI